MSGVFEISAWVQSITALQMGIKMKTIQAGFIIISLFISANVLAQIPGESFTGIKAYPVSPSDKAASSQSLKVKFGSQGTILSPVEFNKKNPNHRHLLIDSKELPVMKMPMA